MEIKFINLSEESAGLVDIDGLSEIHLKVRRQQERDSQNIFSNIEDSKIDLNDLANYYIKPGGTFIVAVRGQRIIGFIGLKNLGNNCGQIKRFAVLKEYRRNGYGTELLENIVFWAKNNGYKKLKLATGFEENARNLYEKIGFKIVNKDYSSDDYLMELDFQEE